MFFNFHRQKAYYSLFHEKLFSEIKVVGIEALLDSGETAILNWEHGLEKFTGASGSIQKPDSNKNSKVSPRSSGSDPGEDEGTVSLHFKQVPRLVLRYFKV